MGLFSVFNQVVKVGLDIVTLPINVVKDVVDTVTFDIDPSDTSTGNEIGKIFKDIEDIPDKMNK